MLREFLKRLLVAAIIALAVGAARHAFSQGVPIGALPSATTPLGGGEYTILSQNGTTVKATVSAFAAPILSIPTSTMLGNVSGVTAQASALTTTQIDTLLGLGTAAFQNTGQSGHTLPFLNMANTWSALQTLTAGISISGGVTITGGLTADTLHITSTSQFDGTATFSGAIAGSPANANVVFSPTGTGTVTINPATAGHLDNTIIGASTRAALSATTGNFNSTLTFPTPFTLGATSVTTTGTQFNYLSSAAGTTGTASTNIVFSASPTFTGTVTVPTPFTIGAISMTSTGTQLNYLSSATGTTGTTNTNVVFSASPTFSGTLGGSNILPLTGIAQIATNTVLGNATNATANVVVQSMPSCSTSSSALTWTTNTGFGCNTIATYMTWGGAKTTAFNATANTQYCVDTQTTGAVTMTLPASPTDGDKILFLDCKSYFAVVNFTVARNGKTIMGSATDMTVNTNNATATLVYVSTYGDWRMF